MKGKTHSLESRESHARSLRRLKLSMHLYADLHIILA